MLRRLYDWTLDQAARPGAERTLAFVSFIESSVFPIPPDVLLVPMVLADRLKAWRIALICTLASVLGGIAGYFIGAVLFEQVGEPVLAFWGYDAKFTAFQEQYETWGAWAVLFAGLTPFPFKVITILSGAVSLDIWVFTVSALIARGLRFYVEAALLWKFGEPIRDFVEKRLGWVAAVSLFALIGGFVLAKYLL
ncbi:MAG: YqaA family protein [Rhodospirillales bacterium]